MLKALNISDLGEFLLSYRFVAFPYLLEKVLKLLIKTNFIVYLTCSSMSRIALLSFRLSTFQVVHLVKILVQIRIKPYQVVTKIRERRSLY